MGLGNMGNPVAARLIQCGHRLLAYDANAEQLNSASALGADLARSADEVAQGCQTILLSLPNPTVVREVVDGLIERGNPGLVIVDLSTNDPQTARDLDRSAVARNMSYIDAPVSGGPSRALTGELSVMVGGNEQAVEGIRGLLSDLGTQVEHVGPAGSGSIAKLLNNFVALWGMVGVSQAFLAAEALDVSLDRLYDVMSRSSGRSYSLDRNFPKIKNRDFSPKFTLTLAQKDLRLGLDLMRSVGLKAFAEADLRALFSVAAQGDAEMDVAVIHERLRRSSASPAGPLGTTRQEPR
ncbi:MAG: NAD(P)-dependent oxidoreductase [Burkholderiales bacterium]|nr:NAD(P)-dependent oxidoreductase [Burkholderiales bacterium]